MTVVNRQGQLIECVPNFSEGRDPAVIKRITTSINEVPGARVIHTDSGKDANRTVVTIVGSPVAVEEAAFRAIRTASDLIDMRQHTGTHPRVGATDVCPVIPVTGVTMEECVALSHRLGRRVGAELGIPVYLYANSTRRPDRQRLPDIRRGEYEALPAKLMTTEFAPDFGPQLFVPRAGVTVIGARDFMIAYNINLDTRDSAVASDIALTLRERGRVRRDDNGAVVRGEGGRVLRDPGHLKFCQAKGWYVAEYGCAQVTMNLHNFRVTGLERAYGATTAEAVALGVRVTGSELVGMVPLEAMVQAGRHFLEVTGRDTGIPERDVVEVAVEELGLREVTPFVTDERVIEYVLARQGAAERPER